MKQQIKITNSQDSVTIDIEGTIGVPEQWQFDEPQQRVATYETFRKSLQQIEQLESPEVVVNIRSTGGDVNDALLIYDALRSLNASIITRCYGYVASAATVIAQAASEGQRELSTNVLYLVHNSQCSVEGTAEELAQRIELLQKTDERLSELYAERSGGDATTFRELMGEQSGAGRWLNASETIELGLADRVIEATITEVEVDEQEVEPSVIERALSNVSNMVSRIGAQIRASILQDEVDDEAGQVDEEQVTTPSEIEQRVVETQSDIALKAKSQASQIAFEEGQKSLSKSMVEPREDPSLNEARRSANYDAYDMDAKRLKR